MTDLKNFESIYRYNAYLRGEQPDQVKMYKYLDLLWNMTIDEKLQDSLNENRVVISIPAMMHELWNYGYHDIVGDMGIKMYLLDPVTDYMRKRIIKQIYIDIPSVELIMVQWILKRLEKRYNLGSWEQFAKEYK